MLGITAISATGDFKQTNTCVGFTLPVGSSCAVSVSFTPSKTGSLNGTVTITYDMGSSPVTLHLSGKGEARIYLPVTIR